MVRRVAKGTSDLCNDLCNDLYNTMSNVTRMLCSLSARHLRSSPAAVYATPAPRAQNRSSASLAPSVGSAQYLVDAAAASTDEAASPSWVREQLRSSSSRSGERNPSELRMSTSHRPQCGSRL